MGDIEELFAFQLLCRYLLSFLLQFAQFESYFVVSVLSEGRVGRGEMSISTMYSYFAAMMLCLREGVSVSAFYFELGGLAKFLFEVRAARSGSLSP